MEHQRRLFVYIATSLDGYIARPNEDLDWLNMVEMPGEDYGYGAFIDQIDTVILGRRTYEKVLGMGVGFPHQNKEVYVITRTQRPSEGNIHFYGGDLRQLLDSIRQKDGRHIFCDGGAEVIHQLMQAGLVDEWIISYIPIFLGTGIRLFQDGRPETLLELVESRSFPSGLVQVHYRKKKTEE